MIDLAMIAPSTETASKGHLHDLLKFTVLFVLFSTKPVSKKKIQNQQWHKFTVNLQSNVSLTIDKNYPLLMTDFQFQQDQIELS